MRVIGAIIILILIISPVSLFLTFSSQMEGDLADQRITQNVVISNLIDHGPITIIGDSDFETQGWPGGGNKTSPYIIEGLSIISNVSCIRIEDTSVNFVIRNCTFSSNNTETPQRGTSIDLYNVTNGVIENCTMYGQSCAFESTYAEHTSFRRNTVYDFNGYVINGDYLVNCSFEDNTMYDLIDDVFLIHNVENCTFSGNLIYDIQEPVFLLSVSNGCTISSNTIMNIEGYGILMSDVDECLITDNMIFNTTGGIGVGPVNNTIVARNVVEHSRVHEGISISRGENCNIEENTISESKHQSRSISLYEVIDSSLYHNLVFNNTFDGVLLRNVDYCNITYNEIHENGRVGIRVDENCTMNRFFGNVLFDNADSNALDDGLSNQWDDGISIGNTWGDYNGIGVYVVPGSAGSVDHYPTGITSSSNGTDNLVLVYVGIIGGVVIVLALLIYVRKR
ncbi:MAG: right-handed parallel beta-helix repeat-containing protein [Candidatus Thorarchaeota archaeon]|nr:right-handed parallel beta-helix repeat-containing protein [Candidatus Thorarchaeota archaeon]